MNTQIFKSRFKSLARKFAADARGNLTMMLSISALPLIMAAGVGIDYGRMSADASAFGAAVDSALLAVVASDRASLTGLSTSQTATRMADLNKYALGYIKKNYSAESSVMDSISASLTITDSSVSITATHTLPTSLMVLAGRTSATLTVNQEVKKGARPVELVMVMDTTGSMGTTYMNQAKTAAHNLMNKIYGGIKTVKTESPYIRVAIVPFSGSVRLDKNAYDYDSSWIDTTGASSMSHLNFSDTTWHNYLAWTKLTSQSWNGYIEARPRGSAPFDYNTNDAAPVSGDSLFVPYFAPDEPTFSGSTSSPYNFLNSYISNSGTPNEQTGLASTSTSSSNWLPRQENVSKYVNKSITSESSSDYGPWFNCVKTPSCR